jgi:hypothetical protein
MTDWSEQYSPRHNTALLDCSKTKESLFQGMLKLVIFIVLMGVLLMLCRVSCVYVWIVLITSLLGMLFCQMHYLWIVVAASFVVSFYVGCQVGNEWITVRTQFSVR